MNFEKIQRGLQKIAGKVFVTSPKTAQDIVHAFQMESIWNQFGLTRHDIPTSFYKACIEEEDFAYCIFGSDTTARLVTENIVRTERHYLMDGTFKIVPTGCFKQLLIIYVTYLENVNIHYIIYYICLDASSKCDTARAPPCIEKYTCPYCRQQIHDIIQVYN